jgi:hypothetical protein
VPEAGFPFVLIDTPPGGEFVVVDEGVSMPAVPVVQVPPPPVVAAPPPPPIAPAPYVAPVYAPKQDRN